MAEMLGRATGVCGGRAGSMNVIDLEHGLWAASGSSAAASPPPPARRWRSSAAAASRSRSSATAPTNQGYFHECLNFATVHGLPVVFVCENNLYGEFTPCEQVTAGRDRRPRRARSGMPAAAVDGNDVWAVREAAAEVVERARGGGGPKFIEA